VVAEDYLQLARFGNRLLWRPAGPHTDRLRWPERVWHVNYSGENPALTPNVTYTYDEARTGFYNQGQPTTITTAALGGALKPRLRLTTRFSVVLHPIGKDRCTTYTMTYGYNTVDC